LTRHITAEDIFGPNLGSMRKTTGGPTQHMRMTWEQVLTEILEIY